MMNCCLQYKKFLQENTGEPARCKIFQTVQQFWNKIATHTKKTSISKLSILVSYRSINVLNMREQTPDFGVTFLLPKCVTSFVSILWRRKEYDWQHLKYERSCNNENISKAFFIFFSIYYGLNITNKHQNILMNLVRKVH